MNILKNKSYNNPNYLSRYSSFPYYYNTEDDKYENGITSQLGVEDVPYVLHKVIDYDTLDSLALAYYGRPDYFWIIADFNRIRDPFINLKDHYKSLKIPSISNIYFK